ncbi:hypothetical protein ACROYT_G005371 [Oculina patagonica]
MEICAKSASYLERSNKQKREPIKMNESSDSNDQSDTGIHPDIEHIFAALLGSILSTPSYNDRVALLNQYLHVVLETLPFAELWPHNGASKAKRFSPV